MAVTHTSRFPENKLLYVGRKKRYNKKSPIKATDLLLEQFQPQFNFKATLYLRSEQLFFQDTSTTLYAEQEERII